MNPLATDNTTEVKAMLGDSGGRLIQGRRGLRFVCHEKEKRCNSIAIKIR